MRKLSWRKPSPSPSKGEATHVPQGDATFVRPRPENNSTNRLENSSTLPWPMQLAVPVASLITFGTHLLLSKQSPPLETHSYMLLFWEILGVSVVLAIALGFWSALRQWIRQMWPIFPSTLLLSSLWA